MFCPNCGTELKAYRHYNPKTNKWSCDCGVVIEEKFDFEEKCWKLMLYYGGAEGKEWR